MACCKFHPLTAGAFHCHDCQENFCALCVDHSVGGEASCFLCGKQVTFQVSADDVDPFWRRLDKAFRYPLNSSALSMVVGLSLATAIVSTLPLPGLIAFIVQVFLAGVTVNYAFLCLKETSAGSWVAPPLSDALEGSFRVIWKLFLMVVLIVAVLYALAVYLSVVMAIIAATVLFIGLPAILMCFAHSESVVDAVNPVNFLRVITAVGLPYAVLILFMFIMISSVGVLNELIGNRILGISTVLQSSVSHYYSLVTFHLMGYMLYQYQDRLGFSVKDDETLLTQAEPGEVIQAHVNVRLKMGDFERAVQLLRDGVAAHPRHFALWVRYFEVSYRLMRGKELAIFATRYFQILLTRAQQDRLLSDFKKTRQLLPAYRPEDPDLRLHLASLCRQSGDAKTAVQLLNGLHKQHPDFPELVQAYQLMANALDDLPGMDGQAQKCRQLIEKLPTAVSQAQATVQDSGLSGESDGVVEATVAEEPERSKDDPIEFK